MEKDDIFKLKKKGFLFIAYQSIKYRTTGHLQSCILAKLLIAKKNVLTSNYETHLYNL